MKIEVYENTISMDSYVKDYVKPDTFLPFCRECENFEKKWACPPYDFDPADYWKKFSYFRVIGKKVFIEEEDMTELEKNLRSMLREFLGQLYEEEKKYKGGVCLNPGSCQLCGSDKCTRSSGMPCRFPEKMRYSIESLGGDVSKTVSDVLGIKLNWIEDGRLPEYLVFVGGILY